MREERIGDCRLILGDCREVVPEAGTVAAIITDPPYCSGGFSETAKKQAKGMGLRSDTIREIGWFSGDNMSGSGISWFMGALAAWWHRALPDGGTATVFTDWRMVAQLSAAIESARFRFQNLVVWNKGNAGLGTGFRAQHELAMHFAKGTPTYYSFNYGNVLSAPRIPTSEREHWTEKPVGLMAQIIDVVAPVGGLVMDPFMGSASTGVACIKMGRSFLGVEIDEGCFSAACRRIEIAYREPRLALLEPSQRPEQLTLLEAA